MRSLLAQPNLLADAAKTIALYRPRVGFEQHRSFHKDTNANLGARTRTYSSGAALLFDCQQAAGGSSLVFNRSDQR
jgi:hypothetical protein